MSELEEKAAFSYTGKHQAWQSYFIVRVTLG